MSKKMKNVDFFWKNALACWPAKQCDKFGKQKNKKTRHELKHILMSNYCLCDPAGLGIDELWILYALEVL